MDKKGDVNLFVTIILIIAAAFVLFTFLSKSAKVEKEKEDAQICRMSALLKAASNIPVFVFGRTGSNVQLRCKTKYIKLAANDEFDLKYGVGELMKESWWQFGEGKLKYYDEWSSDVYCVRNYIIEFDESLRKKYPQGIIGLGEFLANTKMPSSELTYLEYLTNKGNTYTKGPNFEDKIDLNKKYAIVFIEGSGGKLRDVTTWSALGATTGLVLSFFTPIGLVAGVAAFGVGGSVFGALIADEGYNALVFMPYDQLKETCTTLG